MSLPPAYRPFIDEEEDNKRKSEIEDMMRFERPRYFRDEGVQQEYRDILDRGEARRNAIEAQREQAERAARGPGQFDLALANFMERKRAEGATSNPATTPWPLFASLTLPSGASLPNEDAGDVNDRFSPDAMLDRAAKAGGFKLAGTEERPAAPPRPYRVAQANAPAQNAYPGVEPNDTSWLFDGGEAEARSIFRGNDAAPNRAAKSDRLPPSGAALGLPDAGIGKADRLPVARPELPQSPPAFDSLRNGFVAGGPDGAGVSPVRRQDDPARAFEVDTPLRFDGENRVEQLQLRRAKTRKLPIKQTLEDQINYAAQKNGVGIEVHSGGQVSKEKSRFEETGIEDRVGSIRHDDGDAADVDLYVIENGKRRYLDSKNPEDMKIMESFIRDVVTAGATGIGHGYMKVYADGLITKTRRIHVGGGDALSWGNGEEGNRGIPWVEDARREGVTTREKLLKRKAWQHPTAPLKFVLP